VGGHEHAAGLEPGPAPGQVQQELARPRIGLDLERPVRHEGRALAQRVFDLAAQLTADENVDEGTRDGHGCCDRERRD
jgi:hypothetical protein